MLAFNHKLWHQGTINPERTHRRVIFWSLGEGKPGYTKFAQHFHDKAGHAGGNAPWSDRLLQDAPPHRIDMLDVYARDTAKFQSLHGVV